LFIESHKGDKLRRVFAILTFANLISFFLLVTPCLSIGGTNFTITGTITKIKYLQKYIDEDTILQLVRLPKSGFSTDSDEKHRYYYKSNLAKIPFPRNGIFTISAENLEPGKYFLSGQFFNNGRVGPMLMKGKFPATIYVKSNQNSPQKIDFGEVFFQY